MRIYLQFAIREAAKASGIWNKAPYLEDMPAQVLGKFLSNRKLKLAIIYAAKSNIRSYMHSFYFSMHAEIIMHGGCSHTTVINAWYNSYLSQDLRMYIII